MSKKAFTLIELLAVIVILAIILVIAVPKILGMIERIRDNAYQLSMDLMRKVTETYVQSGQIDITGNTAVVTLDELVEKKYMNPIKDSKNTSTECIGYVEVEINGSDTTYTPYLKCGSNFVSENYDPVIAGEEEPLPVNATVHETTVPNGYTGIYKIEDLNNIRNSLSGKYILMNDLDFNSDSSYANPADKPTYTTGTGWNPIGNSTTPFTGQLNGNNYIIKNLYINRSISYVGLFGYMNTTNALIEKIGLEDVNILTGHDYVGGLVGQNNLGTIRNVYITGNVRNVKSSPWYYVGGIAGGISGTSTDKAKVENSYSLATVSGYTVVGGLVGSSTYGDIINSYNAGNIVATGSSNVGGLFGGGSYTTITNSYIKNDITITTPGTPNTNGTSVVVALLQSQMFIKYTLGWDIDNIWYSVDDTYPKLGGTSGNKVTIRYNIAKIEDLYLIRNDLAGNYTLMNDLDFNNADNYRNPSLMSAWTQGEGWLPIGDSSAGNKFTGTLNGNYHKISNLYINRLISYVGLFGYMDTPNALIEKIELENVNILTGHDYVGGIAAYNYSGTIKNSYTTGIVKGIGVYPWYYVGGIVGGMFGTSSNKAKVENCYSTALVNGYTAVGGIIGLSSYGNIINSYGAGNITAGGSNDVGGLVGAISNTTITNSYRRSDATITMSSGTPNTYGTSASTAELQSQMFIKFILGWDIDNIWNSIDNTYPKLGGTTSSKVTFQYNITKIEDLYLIRKDLAGNYTLMNDLDFNNANSYRNPSLMSTYTTGAGWLPIGSSSSGDRFTGTLNGNGHKISNLYINRVNSYIGLFAYMDTPNALIEKLGLENINIPTGYDYVGGIAAYNYSGTIKNSYTTGIVKGIGVYPWYYVGGIVGGMFGTSSNKAKVENCYSTALVNGYTAVGGIIGYSSNGNIINSYAAGNITAGGSNDVGGLVGISSSTTITNSYRSSDATITMSSGTPNTYGTSTSSSNLQALNQTGLTTWDTSTIWQVNSGAYPTFK